MVLVKNELLAHVEFFLIIIIIPSYTKNIN